MTLRTLLSATAILAATVVGAQAATVEYLTGAPVPSVSPTPISTTGAVNQGLTTSVTNEYLSPWEGTAHYGTATYTSVQRGGSATYGLSDPVTLLWGSPDAYNTLAFYLGDSLVDSITGSSITATLNKAFVTISSAFAFDKVVFSSSQNSFEYSVYPAPAPVPLPAAGLLLVGGLGGLAALKRRRSA